MYDFFSDEASTPALELRPKIAGPAATQSDAKDRMMKKMQQLSFLRQGHDGPETGTRYNLPSQGG